MTRRRSRSRDDWDWYPPASQPRAAAGIKAKSRRGKIGETWWADKWIAALEPLLDAGRLSRGRSYARKGQVLHLDISPGQVRSNVQGSRATPYRVTIAVRTLTDDQWDQVIDALASQAIFAAKLLAGEMPREVETAFWAAHVSLFPTTRSDLDTECSCPDWANPCKHVAAVYYLLGERFDEDPFLIFELRGRQRERLLRELRARRTDKAELAEEAALYSVETIAESTDISADQADHHGLPWAENVTAIDEEDDSPLEQLLDRFWEVGQEVDHFHAPITRPAVNGALLKRLGRPPFERKPGQITEVLALAYPLATAGVLRLALGEDDPADEDLCERSDP